MRLIQQCMKRTEQDVAQRLVRLWRDEVVAEIQSQAQQKEGLRRMQAVVQRWLRAVVVRAVEHWNLNLLHAAEDKRPGDEAQGFGGPARI
jgi:hypothetical protein